MGVRKSFCNFVKKWLQHRYFTVKFAKFIKNFFLQDTSCGCFCNVHGNNNQAFFTCTEASFHRQLNFRKKVFVEKNHQPNSSSFNEATLGIKEAATRGVLWKKVFLEVSQNSQANNCARVSFLIKLQAWGLQLYQKRGSGTSVFLWILWNF